MTRERFGLAFAALIVVVGLMALSIEFDTSISGSLQRHLSLAEALYLHFRFFTIMSNWGLVILLITMIVRDLRGQPLPHARYFGATLVYIIVVGATYEILLRHTGMTHDIFFFTDMIMHDIVPAFYVAFWLGFAPKKGLAYRDARLWLLFPAVYLAMTLVAGAFGEGYPYFFVNAAKFGYESVATNSLIFLIVFYLLGVGAVMLSRVTPRGLSNRLPLVQDPACTGRLTDDRSPAV